MDFPAFLSVRLLFVTLHEIEPEQGDTSQEQQYDPVV